MRITKKIAERLELRDDATPYGGKAHSDEHLDEFMESVMGALPYGSSLKKVNEGLVECGLEPFTEEEVKEVALAIKSEGVANKLTSEKLSEITCKARDLRDKAYTMTLEAIKRVLKEHGGKIDTIFSAEQIANEEYDYDELIVITSIDDEHIYYLYGLQIGADNTLKFLVVNSTNRQKEVLSNYNDDLPYMALDYDIIIIADALECELENIEYEEKNMNFKKYR